ncbi:hypothetical protein AMK10_06295 [Streptomyces sp. CB02058]|nr:hypothetical protein AMK10_06295 [Streptomyces sp. CB02058]
MNGAAGDGTRAGAWIVGRAGVDRCTGSTPPERPLPDAVFATARTGPRSAGPGPEPEPPAGTEPVTGAARVGLTGKAAGAAPCRRTGTGGSADRCTEGTAAEGAAPGAPAAMGGVGPVGGAERPASDPLSGRSGTPGAGAPDAGAGPVAGGTARRAGAGCVDAEGAWARGPATGPGPAEGAPSRDTGGRTAGPGPVAGPLGAGTAPLPDGPGAAVRRTGPEALVVPAPGPAAPVDARVGTTGRPWTLPGPGTAPLAPVTAPGEPEERGRESGAAPVVVGGRTPGAPPSAAASRGRTGCAGAGAAGTGPVDGPPAAGER